MKKFITVVLAMIFCICMIMTAQAEEALDTDTDTSVESESSSDEEAPCEEEELYTGPSSDINVVTEKEEAVAIKVEKPEAPAAPNVEIHAGNVRAESSESFATGIAIEADSTAVTVEAKTVFADAAYDAVGVSVDTREVFEEPEESGYIPEPAEPAPAADVKVTVDDVGAISNTEGCAALGVVAVADDGDSVEIAVGEGGITTIGTSISTAIQVEAYGEDAQISTTVAGDVQAAADSGLAIGIDADAEDGADVKISVEGDVFASASQDVDGFCEAVGVTACVENATMSVDTGSIDADAGNLAFGLDVVNYDGTFEAVVDGDITSTGAAILLENQGNSDTDILVTGTVHGDELAILLDEDIIPEDVQITAWKVDLNERGNIAETCLGETTAATKKVEENILYIIKVKQPKKGGFIEVTDAKGMSLAKSHGYDVAKENDKVLMKVNLQKGYKIVGAYGDKGEKLPLMQDENGDWFVIVPRGGGVQLTAKLAKIEASNVRKILTIYDTEKEAEIDFFNTGVYTARAENEKENGRFRFVDEKIVLVSNDNVETEIEIDPDGRYRLSYNSFEFLPSAEQVQLLIAASCK